MKKLILSILIFPLTTAVFAQFGDADTLNEAIVKPGPWPAISDAGRQSVVVTAAEIAALPVRDVSELLKYLPGVEVQARGPFGTQADISLRGATFNQVLVLIDGMEVNDPLTGHFNMNLPVLLGDIEQIEILKGPAASMYGPDAVGGVIMIRTRSFDSFRMKKTSLRADLTGGGHGLRGAELIGTTGNGGSLGGRWLQSDGQLLNGPDAPSYFKQYGLSSARILQWKSGLLLRVRVSYDYRDFDARYYYTNSTLDQSREKVERVWGQSSLEKRWKNNSETIWSTAIAITSDSFIFNPLFTPNVHTGNTQRTRLLHRFAGNGPNKISVGMDGEYVQVKSNDRGDHQLGHAGAFGIWTFKPSLSWNMQFSSRLDYEKAYGLKVVPQLDVNYKFARWKAHLSAGRSIRSADITERYVSTNLPGPLSGGRNLGNPDLNTEDAWNIEAGVRSSWRSPVQLSASSFMRKSNNLIDYIYTPGSEIRNAGNISDTLSYFYARNFGEMNLAGLDIAAHWRYRKGELECRGTIGYLLLKQTGGEMVASKYLANYAGNLVSSQGHVSYRNVYLSWQALYKSREEAYAMAINKNLDPDYFVINTGLGAYLWHKRIDWSLQCLNMFNAGYSDILGAPMPERWIYSRIILRLQKQEKIQ